MATVNNNVWELGEKYKAAEYAKSVLPIQSKLLETRLLTKVCQQMSASYDEVIDEQNEYLFEIENINEEIETLREDLELEIKNKEKEIENYIKTTQGKK